MRRVSISVACLAAAGILAAFIFTAPVAEKHPPRHAALVSIAELVQRESEVTRELHMLKFGQTLNLMALLESEKNFAESVIVLKSVLTAEFDKSVAELNRVARHRNRHIAEFKSNWAIHRNSRSSVLRVPARIIEQSNPDMRADLLSHFHQIERDFLIEGDVERHLPSLPARLARLEGVVREQATGEGVKYFTAYKRHLELYIASRAKLIEAVNKSEEFSVRPVLEKLRDDLLNI